MAKPIAICENNPADKARPAEHRGSSTISIASSRAPLPIRLEVGRGNPREISAVAKGRWVSLRSTHPTS
jgi:hypothetical protein